MLRYTLLIFCRFTHLHSSVFFQDLHPYTALWFLYTCTFTTSLFTSPLYFCKLAKLKTCYVCRFSPWYPSLFLKIYILAPVSVFADVNPYNPLNFCKFTHLPIFVYLHSSIPLYICKFTPLHLCLIPIYLHHYTISIWKDFHRYTPLYLCRFAPLNAFLFW